MIFGIGTDIAGVRRFKKWVERPELIDRFFNSAEKSLGTSESALCQHYAARFAAKEAFSKALGTGIRDFELKDVYIENDAYGKPVLRVCKTAEQVLFEKCGVCTVHVSLSHEKEYAVAFVVIET